MNLHFILSIVAVTVFFCLYEALIHGFLLADMYQATAHLWRAPEVMDSMMIYYQVILLGFAALCVTFYTKFFNEYNVKTGAIFGLFVALFQSLMFISNYIFYTLTEVLVTAWVLASLPEGVIAGVIIGAVYKKKD